jgi:Tol biopolymer transport system component
MIGQRLGSYQIIAKLGEGGMGEVYRARDTTLDRDVAIKLLPESFAADPDRVARFEREAKTLAALNHPNIAQIYGIQSRALVMELVEGDDLAERLQRGPLPVDEALEIGRQIADALAAAHESGIIHRDLKPANIKVRPDGTVKVLDFGLAKLDAPAKAGALTSDNEVRNAATFTSPAMTAAGIILGTAAYMAPEQASGKLVDKRADIWAFGVVLYEMLTGTPPFAGNSVSETLAEVLKSGPDWSPFESPALLPLRAVLAACLEKDPRRRLRDISDVRLLLDGRVAGIAPPTRTRPASRRIHLAWAVACVGALALGIWLAAFRSSPAELPLRRFELKLPSAVGGVATAAAISPDGSRVAYVGSGRLWLHDLSTLEAREVPGTLDAFQPFWSPDSQWIAYGSGRRLWKVQASGGAPVAIADVAEDFSPAAGGAWFADGRIVFTTGFSGLLEVSDRGGDVRVVLPIDETTDLDFHEATALPGGRGVLFYVHGRPGSPNGIAVFDGTTRRMVLHEQGLVFDFPAYSPTGHVLYRRAPTNPGIWAVPFSLDTLSSTGEPFLVVPGHHMPSVAADGTLAYAAGGSGLAQDARLTWIDRAGTVVGAIGEVEPGLQFPVLSRDGRRVAVATTDGTLWVYDAVAGARTRLMADAGLNVEPAWLPDGNRLVHVSRPSLDAGLPQLVIRGVDGATSSSTIGEGQRPDVSADGRHLVYQTYGGGGRAGIMRMDLQKPDPAVIVVNDPAATEREPALSPDGRWLAFTSDASGRNEVYVVSFPDAERRWQVSNAGGTFPRWRADGRELFYLAGDTLMASSVADSATFAAGAPAALLRADRLSAGFDVAADGKRFLVVRNQEAASTRSITVVQNWFAQFRAR